MTKDERAKLYYRIFVSVFSIAVGFAFYFIPEFEVNQTMIDGEKDGIKVNLTVPIAFITFGFMVLVGLFDWSLDFVLGIKNIRTAIKNKR